MIRRDRPCVVSATGCVTTHEAAYGITRSHALYRVLSADDPADNLTLEVASFGCIADAGAALAPFVTGQGFPHGATPAIAVPTPSRQRA